MQAMRYRQPLFTLIFVALALPAFAQTHSFKIRDGKVVSNGGQAAQQAGDAATAANREQQYMFAALSALMQKDYAQAERLYSQVIQHNQANSEAFLQRAVVQRELRNVPAMKADAKVALRLLTAEIRLQPRKHRLYHQRSMALRLLGAFDHAKKDLLTAVQLKGKSTLAYQNDLRAIELEKRMVRSAR